MDHVSERSPIEIDSNEEDVVKPIKRGETPSFDRKASMLTIVSVNTEWPPGSIGERTEKIRESRLADSSSFPRKVWMIVTAIVVSSIVLHGMVVFFVEVLVGGSFSRYQQGKHFVDLGNAQTQTIEKTIPDVQEWYRRFDKTETLLPLPRDLSPTQHGNECLDRWFRDIEDAIPLTSPDLVELALFNLGLFKSPLVSMHLDTLLNEPHAVSTMINDTTRCFKESIPLQRLCTVLEQSDIQPTLNNTKQKHALEYLVNLYAVNEVLTSTAVTDMPLLFELVAAVKEQRQSIEDYYEEVFSGDRAEYAKVKLRVATTGLETVGRTLAENVNNVSKSMLQVNILDAVKIDAILGHEANARVGLAVAAAVASNPSVQDNTLVWKLGKDWVNAYVAWNFAFLFSSAPLDSSVKLFLPSISCAASQSNGESFISPLIISMVLDLLHATRARFEELPSSTLVEKATLDDIHEFLNKEVVNDLHTHERYVSADTMGESNLKHTRLASPFPDQVEEMLYTLCGGDCHNTAWKVTDSTPQSLLTDEAFRVYFGIVIWTTVLIAGFGCELLFLIMLSRFGWSEEQETRWWFAEFLFPLLLLTTLGFAMLRNFWALPFLVLGLWKSGMPETLSYMFTALFNAKKAKTSRLADFINSVATALHHSSATMAVAFMLSGVIPANRHTLGVPLILTMQHWFVLIKHVNVWIYRVVELVLEAFFQWAVLADLEYLYALHWTIAYSAIGIFMAHWLYLVAGFIEIVNSTRDEGRADHAEEETKVDFDQMPPAQALSVGENIDMADHE